MLDGEESVEKMHVRRESKAYVSACPVLLYAGGGGCSGTIVVKHCGGK